MELPKTETTPDDPGRLPPARRRRARRLLAPLNTDERADFTTRLARRAAPSVDFFLFSLISSAVIGVGMAVDSNAILVLGILSAPFMAPAVGLSLGTVVGSMRLFLRSLGGLLVGGALVVCSGALAGLAFQDRLPGELVLAHQAAQLAWDDFLVLALGSILTAASMARMERDPTLPSAALAYALYPPLTTAGFGLTSQVPHLWPDGLVVSLVLLAWSALLGAITLAILGFRPLTLFGYTLGGAMTLLGVILMIGISGVGAMWGADVALPTPSPTVTLTPSPTVTVTLTPVPPTLTPTTTSTLTPTLTPTLTVTPSPTPVYALVDAGDQGGAFIRTEPGFGTERITVLANGTLVQILSEKPVQEGNNLWLFVRTPEGVEGWMVEYVLIVATPAPNWTP